MKYLTYLVMIALGVIILSCEDHDIHDKEGLPEVKTISSEVVSLDTVILTGEVTDESGAVVTQRGFCWGTGSEPTVSDNYSENRMGSGKFSEKVVLLEINRDYYYRTYAVNANGLAYGNIKKLMIEFNPTAGSFTDSRDGNVYPTVNIKDQTWIARNLAYLPSINWSTSSPGYSVYEFNSRFGIDSAKASTNYTLYGVLYNWPAAVTACPDGWHLPTDSEWTRLIRFLGVDAAKRMKSHSAWWPGGNNLSGLNVLPGGIRNYDGEFSNLGVLAEFWSSTPIDSASSWSLEIYSSSDATSRSPIYHTNSMSIRCLRN
jgi:uncharacterized protein (TIGR02145 family)